MEYRGGENQQVLSQTDPVAIQEKKKKKKTKKREKRNKKKKRKPDTWLQGSRVGQKKKKPGFRGSQWVRHRWGKKERKIKVRV